MAAAGKWKLYESAKEYIGDGTIDLDDNTMKVALFLSTSNVNTLSIATLSAATNQVATAFGYTAGGVTVAATWVRSGGTTTFDCADAVWTAAGGSITARFGVLYRSGTVNAVVDALVAVCLLDTAPADVTATDGNTLTIAMNASGLFTLSGATVD